MKFFLASSTLAAATVGVVAQVYATNIPVKRDATVAFNGIMCDNNTPCNSIPFGHKMELTSFRGNRDFERILLGFDLPANPISKCVLNIPQPIPTGTTDEIELTATVTDNDWEEGTVDGANKRIEGTQVGSVQFQASQKPGNIDVTTSCQRARGGKLSFFIDTSHALISFNSIESKSPEIFSLDVTN